MSSARHKWKVTRVHKQVVQSQCKRCGTIKTAINSIGYFPTVKYETMGGRQTDRAPPCILPPRPSQSQPIAA